MGATRASLAQRVLRGGQNASKEEINRFPATGKVRRKFGHHGYPKRPTTNDGPYRDPNYPYVLEKEAGSLTRTHKQGVIEASKALCQSLLDSNQPVPQDTIFRDDVFANACAMLQGKNEARISMDCTPLIVPGAERHALLSNDRRLDMAIESVNEGWNCPNPITNTRPQPNYAVGFNRPAFSDEQLEKLGL